ncbi:MAG TPA: Ig domain-containing protein [Terracidiphilus sp.]|nr:Ig domain-containing protein [Terracidiphilus sp.]
MKKTRREVIKLGIGVAISNSGVVATGVGAVAAFTGCGGGVGANGPATTNPNPPAATPPSGLSYQSPVQATVGVALTPLSPTVTGSVTGYSVSPAFPAGIALDTSTGVISGTPTASAGEATYTITASNSGGSTTFGLVLTVTKVITINSSTTSPTALTPFALTVTGIDLTQAFTVQLANTTGYSATLTPVRIDSTNSKVVVAAPLYLDPSTGHTAPLTASIQITQNSTTSNSLSLAIGDIPSVASYGVNPGDISRGFFNAMSIGFGMNVNAMQAMRALPTSRTDTATVQSHQSALQLSAIESRGNVDLIVSGTKTSLPVGTSSDGLAVNYDANSVDVLDRIIAMYLQSIGYLPTTIYPPNPLVTVKPYTRKRRRNFLMPESITAKDIIDGLGVVGGEIGVKNAAIQAGSAENSVDSFIAIGQGVSSAALVIGTLGLVAEAPALVAAATIVGTAFAAAAVVNDTYKWWSASTAIDDALANGDVTQFNNAEKQLSDAKANFGVDLLGGTLGVFGFPKEVAEDIGVGVDVVNVLSAAQNGASGVAVQGLSLITSAVGLAVTENGQEMSADGQTMDQSNAEVPTSGNSFGLVEGMTQVSNSNPPDLDPLNGANLTETTTDTEFTTLAGEDGNYMLIVPLNVPGYDYNPMELATYDPVSDESTGAQVPVNLSALTATNPFQAPTITGSCVDSDAGDPDQDDPDCD